MTFVERRRSPRIEIQGRLDTPAAPSVIVREISLGGLSFSSQSAFPVGTVHQFRLTLGDGSEVVVSGRVLRSLQKTADDGSPLFVTGVQFLDDDVEDDQPSIGGLIGKLS
jgi:hypothetical protein